MNTIKKIFPVIIILMVGLLSINSRKPAIIPPPPDPFVELMRIQDAYGSACGVWTTWLYDFHDIDDDTLTDFDAKIASLRISGEKYRFSIDSIVCIQDLLYNVTVYNEDSSLYIQPPQDLYEALLQIDLLDTLFHLRQFHDISITNSSNLRTITIEFENESPFIKYAVTYDTATYLLEEIEYFMKKSVIQPGQAYIPAEDYEDYTRLVISMLGQTIEFQDENYFATQQYIKRQNKTFTGVSSFASYLVVDGTDD